MSIYKNLQHRGVIFRGLALKITFWYHPGFDGNDVEEPYPENIEFETINTFNGDVLITSLFTDELFSELEAMVLTELKQDQQDAAAERRALVADIDDF